ncbi:MAG: M23 family metallopeptidase [Fibrobacteres bacterium]|nr:M23 family metallopeptidase [Fibrobacterota bacterium]
MSMPPLLRASFFGASLVGVFFAEASPVIAAGPPLKEWDRFEKSVRDQTLPKDSLRALFPPLYRALRGSSPPNIEGGFPPGPAGDSPWVFPVQGYSLASVGKGGFRPAIRYGGSPIQGYDFFDGNRHGGHPAYDIFIRDKDRDCRDDLTGAKVPVLAPTRLLVLSTENEWRPGSGLRGGKYLWALSVDADLLLYFAHLDSLIANPGDTVAAGGRLGMVGRTGTNAYPARSPTHLHFMVLKVGNGVPEPFDYYRLLPRSPRTMASKLKGPAPRQAM